MTDWTAELDQTLRGLKDFAKATRTYWVALEAEGFTPNQATVLTSAYIYALTDRG